MQTRSTVLGKRGHQYSSSAPNSLEQLQTPDNTPNPKRAQTAAIVIDGDSNKENIPPFNISPIHIAAMPTSNLMELTPPPSPPASLLPIQARVCALLHSTCNNTSSSIAGRDMEHTALLQFLTSFIDGTSIDHDTHTTSILDHVTPNSQSLASIFSLPHAIPSALRHIGITNTHTLTTSSISATLTPSKNVQIIHFTPYTPTQLQNILQSRLSPLHSNGTRN